MKRLRIRRIHAIVAVALLAASAGGLTYWTRMRLPHRFGVVVPGRLYRCGHISAAQLGRVQREYGIGRVISLLDASAPETIAERAAAGDLHLEWQNVPLPGDGSSTPADRKRLRELLLTAAAPTTLVHCAAGVNRTGLAVGLYRLHAEHWSLDKVLEELRAWGFEDRPEHANLRSALMEEAQLAGSTTN